MKNITFKIIYKSFAFIALFLFIFIFQNNILAQSPPAVPGNVNAIPDSIICGGNSALNATTAGNGIIIRWWDASTGGIMIGTSENGINFNVTLSSTFNYYAESYDTVSGLSSATRVAITVFVTPIPTPTSVMVYPSPVQCGSSANLYASTNTGLIRWWDAVSGGNLLGSSLNGVFFNFFPPYSATYYAEAYLTNPVSQTFSYTGSAQSFTVPYGITSLFIDAAGARGGTTSINYGFGGLGGRVQTNLTVVPYQVLNVYVGGQGGSLSSGWNGGE